jgi:hypothetical protein
MAPTWEVDIGELVRLESCRSISLSPEGEDLEANVLWPKDPCAPCDRGAFRSADFLRCGVRENSRLRNTAAMPLRAMPVRGAMTIAGMGNTVATSGAAAIAEAGAGYHLHHGAA